MRSLIALSMLFLLLPTASSASWFCDGVGPNGIPYYSNLTVSISFYQTYMKDNPNAHWGDVCGEMVRGGMSPNAATQVYTNLHNDPNYNWPGFYIGDSWVGEDCNQHFDIQNNQCCSSVVTTDPDDAPIGPSEGTAYARCYFSESE